MKCRNCKKQVKYFEVLAQYAVNPITYDIGDLRKLLGFFQYESPNISSYVCGYLPQKEHGEKLEEMLASWKNENYSFIASNAKTKEYLVEKIYWIVVYVAIVSASCVNENQRTKMDIKKRILNV